MHRRRTFALGGATLALALAGTTVALGPAAALAAKHAGGGTTVTVRVEGLNRTLLTPTQVTAPKTGWITKGGTPKGKCSARTAAGALDVATRHRWTGKWTSSFGLELTGIFGEVHLFSSKDFWSIWVDNKFAPAGLCGLKLHHGEQLLLAAVPDTSNGFPLVLSAPNRTTIGHPFQVTVTYFGQTGKKTPLAHAKVTGRGISATTNAHGVATIGASKAGTLVLKASAPGYIRSAPDSVRVS